MVLSDAHYFEDLGPRKYDEIRKLLDSNDNSSKFEAMKRLIAMLSLGKDASSFFPDVVKNVVASSLEVKKLVYMFLVHYAEQQSDAALLSVNAFQKDLTDGNQLIRAQALRVLASIRVKMIASLQVLAIKKVVRDPSPYVRKAAAIAVIKVFSLDSELSDQLEEIVQVLLQDNSTMVIGSAIAAFEEVCPQALEMIHPHFRKLCRVCADCDEWSQVLIISLLTRYARTQFEDPNKPAPEQGEPEEEPDLMQHEGNLLDEVATEAPVSPAKPAPSQKTKAPKPPRNTLDSFYDSESSDEEEGDAISTPQADAGPVVPKKKVKRPKAGELQEDHKLLLSSTEPLLRSRNAGVVMAVVGLFHYVGPRTIAERSIKSLARLLHSSSEVRSLVLQSMSFLVDDYANALRPYYREFFISCSDPAPVALSKLRLLTRLVDGSNFQAVLKELQAYINLTDDEVVRGAVRAIGQCAALVPAVSANCLAGLMDLARSASNPVVASECVVVMRALLALGVQKQDKFVQRLLRLVDKVEHPSAKASLIWMAGEYRAAAPLSGPDILRKAAKTFTKEDTEVKLQVVTLAAKLLICDPERCRLLYKYVLDMALVDPVFDVKDRAGVIKGVLGSGDTDCVGPLQKYAEVLVSELKPPPEVPSVCPAVFNHTIGTLSFVLGKTISGYTSLPEFPETAPDPSCRAVKESSSMTGSSAPTPAAPTRVGSEALSEFYSKDSDSGSETSESSSEDDDDSSEYETDSDEESSDDDSSSVTSSSSDEAPDRPPARGSKQREGNLIDGFEAPATASTTARKVSKPSVQLDLEAELNAAPMDAPIMAATAPAVSAVSLPRLPLIARNIVHFANAQGLEIDASFTRETSIYGPEYSTVRFKITNRADYPILNVQVSNVQYGESGQDLKCILDLAELRGSSTTSVLASANFACSNAPIKFDVSSQLGTCSAQITLPSGEMVRPVALSVSDYDHLKGKLGGMLETKLKASFPEGDATHIGAAALQCANLACVGTEDGEIRLSGETTTTKKPKPLLVSIDLESGTISARSQESVLAARVGQEIKKHFASAE